MNSAHWCDSEEDGLRERVDFPRFGPSRRAQFTNMSTAPNSVVSVASVVGQQTVDPHPSVTLPQVAHGHAAGLPQVGEPSTADRSAALLSLASSCSLSEILSAQQQALEQIHTQIHLAQQFESITNRLDAIERTLNSLIQQRPPDADQVVESPSVISAPPSLLEAAQTVVTPSPSVNCITVQTASPSTPLSAEKKSRKLPRDLCVSG